MADSLDLDDMNGTQEPTTPGLERKAAAEANLIVNGRYKLAGESYQRVTNFAKSISDNYQLSQWRQRKLARGMALRPDLAAEVLAVANEDEDRSLIPQLDSIVERAVVASGADRGANMGKAMHAMSERLDLGQVFYVPEPFNSDLIAYQEMKERHGLVVDANWIERIIVCERLGVAGTFDRIVTDKKGRVRIADLKTGRLGSYWGDIAVQLAIYANADYIFDPATGEKEALPENLDKDTAYVFGLRPGSGYCELFEVDLKQARTLAFDLIMAVRDWRSLDRTLGRTLEGVLDDEAPVVKKTRAKKGAKNPVESPTPPNEEIPGGQGEAELNAPPPPVDHWPNMPTVQPEHSTPYSDDEWKALTCQWLQCRLDAVKEAGGKALDHFKLQLKLARALTLKQQPEQTWEELRRLDEAIGNTEAKYQLTWQFMPGRFHPAPPSARAIERPTQFDSWQTWLTRECPEGQEINLGELGAMQAAYRSLDMGQRAWVDALTGHAASHDKSIRLVPPTGTPTIRRFEIARALIAASGTEAQGGESFSRLAIMHVTGIEWPEDMPLGLQFALLTKDEASRCADLLTLLCQATLRATVAFEGDRIGLVGTDLAHFAPQ